MSRRADLSPPLGVGGGTCKVVQRIENAVRVPALREDLSEKVEHGGKLTNPEAAIIYEGVQEHGGGLFPSIRITAHAQYRMDQRGITVDDLRVFFTNLSKKVNDWKSQRAPEYPRLMAAVQGLDTFEWTDKKTKNLKVVFSGKGSAMDIITVFWEGKPDPKPGTCGGHAKHHIVARDEENLSGVRTLVKNPKPSKSDTDKPQGTDGKYPTQGDPRPDGKGRSKPGPTPVFNAPGESGSDSSGTIHKDKVRTKGVPGGQYDNNKTHPTPDVTDSQITPNRRPGLTAEVVDADILAGVSPEVFAEMFRMAGMFPPAYPSGQTRHHDQKSQVYRYDHKRYQRLRGRIKQRQKRRYKKLHQDFRFKLDRKRRKDHPERFKTKPGGNKGKTIKERSQQQRDKKALAALDPIPFFFYSKEDWGWVLDVSSDGDVTYEMDDQEFTADLDTFLDEVVIDEDRLDDLEAYLDQVFEYDPDDLEDAEDDEPDTSFDTWLGQGKYASAVIADFFREQRPPDMSSDTKYDRAKDHGDRDRADRPHLEDISEWSGGNSGNPGSKVLPSGAGHVEKQAALIQDIREGCSPDLASKARGLKVSLRRVDAGNAMWLFDVQGSKDPYRVRLQAMRKGTTKAVAKTHVRVSCSCPFWQWQGPEHWAKQGDYLYGKPVGSASQPVIKDPSGQHRACKHVIAVMDHVTSRKWDIPEVRAKQAGLEYLASALDAVGRDPQVERLARRYLASQEVR